ncbi:MAG: hypothetical protein ABEJ55_02725 [Halanaeroarchaeum sp.]
MESTQSFADTVQQPTPMNYIKGIVGTMGALGVLLGIGVYLVGSFGGLALYPGIIQEFSGMQGLDQGLAFTHQLSVAYMANNLAIFLAFLMAPIFGLLVAFRMDGESEAKMGAAGIGVGVGALVFTVIVVYAASMVVPSASELFQIQQQFASSMGGTTAVGSVSGLEQTILQGMDLGSADLTNAVFNGIMVGIPAGIAAAAVVFMDEQFFN